MKRIGKQSKDITLKRVDGDKFEFVLEVGVYYVDNVETGVFINSDGSFLLFDNFEEYWNSHLDVSFWEEILGRTVHEPLSEAEATALTHVVEELRKEVYTGINQLYISDETWIDGLFEIVVE